MNIQGLGPMVVIPADEELDKELERRRLQEEKARAGPVGSSDLGEGGAESATSDEQSQAALRLAGFLKKFQKDKSKKKSPSRKDNVESLEAFAQRRNQLRQKAIRAYEAQRDLSYEELNSISKIA